MNDNLIRRDVFGAVLAAMAGTSVAFSQAASAGDLEPDPIYAAIEALRFAEGELTAALHDLDEADPERVQIADEAADRSGEARNALSRIQPTTPAGFRALVRFHADDIMWLEPDTYGALALRDIVIAMDALLGTHRPPG